MKSMIFSLLWLISVPVLAMEDKQIESEIIVTEASSVEVSKVSIKEVKALIKFVGPENTCMDEYLKRRQQLITKLALAPVVIPVGVYAGLIGTGLAGVHIAAALGADPLAGAVLGIFTGFTGSSVGLLTDTGLGISQLVEVDRILKSLAELHLDRSDVKTEKLFEKYAKNNPDALDQKSFELKLLSLDGEGELCNGSLTTKPGSRVGRRLKKKLARTKHLRSAIL